MNRMFKLPNGKYVNCDKYSTYVPMWPSGTNVTNWTETWLKLLENNLDNYKPSIMKWQIWVGINYLDSPVFVSKMLTSQMATYRYLLGVQTIGSKSLWSSIVFSQNLGGQITPGQYWIWFRCPSIKRQGHRKVWKSGGDSSN